MEHRWVVGDGGVRVHVVRGDGGRAGSGSGSGAPGGAAPGGGVAGGAVVLLHGFPENWTSWRHQMGALTAAGFDVHAVDLRGYNESDRPSSISAYRLRHLVADVAAVVRSTGRERAHIVGHDWGGIVAWAFAGAHPELLHRLVIMNAPHLAIFMRHVRRPPQLLRSWYAGFFRLPWLPELALRARDFAAIRRIFTHTPARPHAFSPDDVEKYIDALRPRGALTAALNYYRALSRDSKPARRARTDAPTLVIWGERDTALGVELLDGIDAYAPNVRIERLPDVGHWVQNEAPDEVNTLLLDFLRAR